MKKLYILLSIFILGFGLESQAQTQAPMSYEQAWARAYSVQPKGTFTNGVPDSIQVLDIKLLQELLGGTWPDVAPQPTGAQPMQMQTMQAGIQSLGGGGMMTMAAAGTAGGGTIGASGYHYLRLSSQAYPIPSSSPASGGTGTLTYSWEYMSMHDWPGAWQTVAGQTGASITSYPSNVKLRRKATWSGGQTAYSNTLNVANPVAGVSKSGGFIETRINSGYHKMYSDRNVTIASYRWGELTLSVKANTGSTERFFDVQLYFDYYDDDDEEIEDEYEFSVHQYGDNPNLIGGTLTLSQNDDTGAISIIGSGSNVSDDLPYVYRWYSSTDNANWILIPGATGEDYSCSAVTTTTYFRREVSTWDDRTAYSNTATTSIIDLLVPGAITLSQDGGSITITGAAPTGGNARYRYQWEQSTDCITWEIISNATNATYYGEVGATVIYFRRKVESAGQTGYSPYVVQSQAYTPPFDAGSISLSKTMANNNSYIMIPSTAAATGGGQGYNYQWQKKSGSGDWTTIQGATGLDLVYPLTENASFRRKVVSRIGNVNQEAYTEAVKAYKSVVELDTQGDEVVVRGVDNGHDFVLNWSDVYYNLTSSLPEDLSRLVSHSHSYDHGGELTFVFKPCDADRMIYGIIDVEVWYEIYYPDGDERRSSTFSVSFVQSSGTHPAEMEVVAPKTTHRVYTGAGGTSPVEEVNYSDGLGRTVQSIKVGASPSEKDIVTFGVYDRMGRGDSIAYLPFVANQNSGAQIADPLAAQQAFYASKFSQTLDKNFAFARKQYDNTGLGLVLAQSSPGEMHSLGNHPTAFEYRLNAAAAIRKYRLVNDSMLCFSGVYAPGTLTVAGSWTVGDDDNQRHETYEYKNAAGQVVAKESRVSATDRRITYYVYDDMGRQRYIVPAIQNDLVTQGTDYAPGDLSLYCYYSEYDARGNVVLQMVPGAGYTFSVYDKLGRLVMSQSPNMRAENLWAVTKYDTYQRTAYTATYSGGTRETHRTALADQTGCEQRGGTLHGYTNATYPVITGSNRVLTVAYYDDYGWVPGSQYAFSAADALGNAPSRPDALNLTTGTKTKVLGGTGDQWLTTVTYYDGKYRTIQSLADLYPGGIEIVSNAHNFTGEVVRTKVKQTVGGASHAYNKWFTFDHVGRLQEIFMQVAGDTDNYMILLASYYYDDLGRLDRKFLHDELTYTSYAYDIAGRNIAQTSPKFSYKLGFERDLQGNAARWDGNLDHVTWKHGTAAEQAYSYSYDNVGQLLSANYFAKSGTAWTASNAYNETTSGYDLNGNISSMLRRTESGDVLHDLTYNYTGNQLVSVGDSDPFVYDANGNMVCDGMTGVEIEYNILNLPSRIYKGSEEINYIYSADGTKLASRVGSSSTYYRSVMVYNGSDELQYMLHPEGLVAKSSGNTYTYKYFLTDHLGSTRVVLAAINSTMVVEQTTDYYPYGLAWDVNNLHLNRYLFGGKELQDASIGGSILGLYDFHARFYHPILGRWFNVDPALQLANPYLYCGNMPHMAIDPDGEIWWFVPLIIGAVAGAYSGGVIANDGEFNPGKWDWSSGKTWGYMFGGAVVGGISGYTGGFIAQSGIPMANTLGIMTGSFMNSIGTHIYTGGQTPISISFGVASYDFTNKQWGYLGKKGNKWYENLAYGFGALANTSDFVSLFSGGGQNLSVNSAKTDKGDWWGHSSITDENGNSLVSVGPDSPVSKAASLSETWQNSIKIADTEWSTYFGESGTWKVGLNNISVNAISNYADGISRWDLLLSSCVGHTSRGLWSAGVPNIYMFHPHVLNFQLLIRQIGIYASPYLYQMPKTRR